MVIICVMIPDQKVREFTYKKGINAFVKFQQNKKFTKYFLQRNTFEFFYK